MFESWRPFLMVSYGFSRLSSAAPSPAAVRWLSWSRRASQWGLQHLPWRSGGPWTLHALSWSPWQCSRYLPPPGAGGSTAASAFIHWRRSEWKHSAGGGCVCVRTSENLYRCRFMFTFKVQCHWCPLESEPYLKTKIPLRHWHTRSTKRKVLFFCKLFPLSLQGSKLHCPLLSISWHWVSGTLTLCCWGWSISSKSRKAN